MGLRFVKRKKDRKKQKRDKIVVEFFNLKCYNLITIDY